MKRFTAIISTLAVIASLTACSEAGTPAQNASKNQSSSQSSTPSPESTVSQGSTSSKESSSTENSSSQEDYDTLRERDYELKGEDLIAKFKWPYDAPIDLDGARARKLVDTTERGDVYEDIELSELSNDINWRVVCDYGYLATAPEDGKDYEFKKYKVGDKIGDFIVKEINTWFSNIEYIGYNDCDYFQGVMASFDGEVTLTGELSIEVDDFYAVDELLFFPDKESCKKLPIVNYRPLLDLQWEAERYYPTTYDNILIELGYREDYPEIDFSKFPVDGTRVKVNVKIANYGYRLIPTLPILGFGDIVDSELELL